MSRKRNKKKLDKDNRKEKLLLKVAKILIETLTIGAGITLTVNGLNLYRKNNNIINGINNEYNNWGEGNIIFNSFETGEILKDATIQVTGLTYEYLRNQENIEQLYFFKQQNEFCDINKDYSYYSDYIGMVTISNNNLNKEIILKKFKFVADNIVVDTTPYLDVWCSRGNNDFLIETALINKGWGIASGIELCFKDSNGYLERLFDEENLCVNVSKLESGECQVLNCIELKSINRKVLEEMLNEYGEFDCCISVYAKSLEKDYEEIGYGILLRFTSQRIEQLDGKGVGADLVYGIIVDTDNNNFAFEAEINENIAAGDILELPICFFPDRTSSFSFHIVFEVFDGYKNYFIESNTYNINFCVDSYEMKNYKKNKEYISKDSCIFGTYPYAQIIKDIYNNGYKLFWK